MVTEVVRSRLRPPRPGPYRIERGRAESAFRQAHGAALVCVEADAGYGKTTFVESVTSSDPRIWYTLTSADRDPTTFLQHVLVGLQGTGAADEVKARSASRPSGWPALLEHLIDPLDAWAAAGGRYLVLDDYHVIEGSILDAVVAQLLDLTPAMVQIVVTSRRRLDPPAWTRARVHDRLQVLDRSTLAFDRDETGRYFEGRFGVSLPNSTLELLVEETEGWPIALSLVGRRLVRGGEAEELLATLPEDRNAIFRFLGEQVFAEQSHQLRQFLLDISVLTLVDARAAAAVSTLDVRTASQMLDAVTSAGLFCVQTGTDTFRMHQLFRRFLQDQVDSGRRRSLHGKAAEHYRRIGLDERAAIHAAQAGQHADAAKDVTRIADELLTSGRHPTLLALSDGLGAAIDREPALLAARSHALRLSSRFSEALASARAARDVDSDVDLIRAALDAELAVHLDTVVPARAEPVLNRLLELEDPGSVDDRGTRRMVDYQIENHINAGRLSQARALMEAEPDQRTSPLAVRLFIREGRLNEARGLLERRHTARSRVPAAHRDRAVLLAWIHALLGHGDRAIDHARDGLAIGDDLRSPLLNVVAMGRLGLAHMTAGSDSDLRAARKHLLTALDAAEQLGVDRFRAEPLLGLTVLAARRDGGQDTMRFGLDAIETLATAGDCYLTAMAQLALGTSLARQSDPGAREWLNRAIDGSTSCGDHFIQLLARQRLAAVELHDGNLPQFADAAQRTLELTQEASLTEVWLTPSWLGIWSRETRANWLNAAIRHTSQPKYAAHLLTRLHERDNGGAGDRMSTTPGLHSVNDTTNEAIEITTLDAFSIRRGATVITSKNWTRRKAAEILINLCASERHSLSRLELIDRLWPDEDPERTGARLRVALHALNHVLEPEREPRAPTMFVCSSQDRIWLNPETVTIDADEFRARLALLKRTVPFDLAAAHDALCLYRQPFMSDYPAIESTLAPRDELAVAFRDLALRTAQVLLQDNHPADAAELCRRLLTADPYVELAYELLAASHLARGDRSGAVKAREDCAHLLMRELGLEPDWDLESCRGLLPAEPAHVRT